MFLKNRAGGIQAVHFRHLEIHHGNVREQIAILAHCILAIYRFPGNLPGILLLQQPQGLLTHQLIVVDHKDIRHETESLARRR